MSYLFSCLEDYAVIDSCAMPFAIIAKSGNILSRVLVKGGKFFAFEPKLSIYICFLFLYNKYVFIIARTHVQ